MSSSVSKQNIAAVTASETSNTINDDDDTTTRARKKHVSLVTTNNDNNDRHGLTRLPADIWGHIQSYFYIDEITLLGLINKLILKTIMNSITSRPFDIVCDPHGRDSTGDLPLVSLNALTMIQHNCYGTVRRLKLPTPWSSSSFRDREKFSFSRQTDALIEVIITQNRQSLLEVVQFGSHVNSKHITLMSTCPRLMKWQPRHKVQLCQNLDEMEPLYRSCTQLSHLSVASEWNMLSRVEPSTPLAWMKGNT
jgi:hypothetical protein